MNIKILLLAISAFTLASCSSTYKNTQTPDDVYYSPAREVVKTETKTVQPNRDLMKRYDFEEREIRMSAYDSRWRSLNNRYNYGYNLSPYDYDYGYQSYNPYYNPYQSNIGYHGYNNNYYGNSGYYYNPYYSTYPIYIVTTTSPVNRTPRKVNLSGYGQNNNTQPISGIKTMNNTGSNSGNGYNNSNSRSRQYNNSNSNSNNGYRPTAPQQTSSENSGRTYTPSSNQSNNNSSGRSSNTSSSSGSSSSSSGSVERPKRGNN